MSSYGTLTASKAYHAERGNTAWAEATDSELDIARLRGSEYVDGRFRSDFPGLKSGGREQVREWPRSGATDASGYAIASDAEPIEVEHASYEAALRELVTPGSLLPDVNPAGQVKRTSEKIGPITEEIEYVTPNSPEAMRPRIPVIDAIMAPLIGRASSSFCGTSARA